MSKFRSAKEIMDSLVFKIQDKFDNEAAYTVLACMSETLLTILSCLEKADMERYARNEERRLQQEKIDKLFSLLELHPIFKKPTANRICARCEVYFSGDEVKTECPICESNEAINGKA